MKALTFDEILEQVGDFGPYQKMSYYFLCTPAIMKAAIVLSAVFVLQLPQFRCAVPGLSNDTFQEQDDHHKHLVDINIPPASGDEEFAQLYSQCHLYANSTTVSQRLANSTLGLDTANTTDQLSKCYSWVYDKSEVHSSILTEHRQEESTAGVCRHPGDLWQQPLLHPLSGGRGRGPLLPGHGGRDVRHQCCHRDGTGWSREANVCGDCGAAVLEPGRTVGCPRGLPDQGLEDLRTGVWAGGGSNLHHGLYSPGVSPVVARQGSVHGGREDHEADRQVQQDYAPGDGPEERRGAQHP